MRGLRAVYGHADGVVLVLERFDAAGRTEQHSLIHAIADPDLARFLAEPRKNGIMDLRLDQERL